VGPADAGRPRAAAGRGIVTPEDARAAYAARAAAAPRERCYRSCRYLMCRWCGDRYLAVDAASLDLDNAQAAQFAEFRPSVRLTTPPKEARP
jgi:hypothetical protein